jgi:hypothetical protein
MPVLTYTRGDVERLADVLEARSQSVMLSDMPRLQHDMKAASKLLKWMITQGMPITTIEIEING